MLAIRNHAAAVAAAVALLAGAGTAMASPAHQTEEVKRPSAVKDLTGGSFESPAIVTSSLTFNSGLTLDNWQVSSGSVNLVRGRWHAADGSQSLDLSGNEPGAVSQTFPTSPGETYVVSYALAGNPESATPVLRTGQVLLNGHVAQNFSFDVTGKTADNMGWTNKTLTFQATSSSTTLTFASTTASSYGPAIDNVKVMGCTGTCGT